jgi:hypothetical protein
LIVESWSKPSGEGFEREESQLIKSKSVTDYNSSCGGAAGRFLSSVGPNAQLAPQGVFCQIAIIILSGARDSTRHTMISRRLAKVLFFMVFMRLINGQIIKRGDSDGKAAEGSNSNSLTENPPCIVHKSRRLL